MALITARVTVGSAGRNVGDCVLVDDATANVQQLIAAGWLLPSACTPGSTIPSIAGTRMTDLADVAGSAAVGTAPVEDASGFFRLTDIATQAELDALAARVNGGSLPLRYDPRATWLGSSLKRILAGADESFGVAVLSDSTAVGAPPNAQWVYTFGQLVAAAYPAYKVRHDLWNDATQDYDVGTVIQVGATGIERGLAFTSTAQPMTQPVANVVRSGADIDLSCRVLMPSWTPASGMEFISHWTAAPNLAFRFRIGIGTKRLSLDWSADGTATITKTATADVPFTDGQTGWLRVTLDVDNGAAGNDVKFYTSNDGVTWTQLGTTITTASTTAVFASTADYTIGGRNGLLGTLTGTLYEVRVRDGIAGPTIAPRLPEAWNATNTTSPVAIGDPLFVISNGSRAGQGLTYLSDATRLPLLLPDYGARAVFLATSHNDGLQRDRVWVAAWVAWIAAVKARAFMATPVIVTENPEISPAGAPQISAHDARHEILLTLASQLGLPVLDAYQAFLDAGPAGFIQADGIHPTTTGGADGAHLWANSVYSAMFPS